MKVLDFGLAKALEGESGEVNISTSPTISAAATRDGGLLGTAAYMSPEQAKGKAVDRRADIWASESGEQRVYVVPFPGPGGKWQVSPGGGCYPRWRRDGKELFYLTEDNKIVAAEIKVEGSSFAIGAVNPLFETRVYRSAFGGYDVSGDDQRFIIAYEPGQPNLAITLVENWDAELKKK